MKRAAFWREVERIDPSRLVFLDEAGFNLSMYSQYGWSVRGERLVEVVPFQRGRNHSVLGAMSLCGMVGTFQKEGSIKRVDLEDFLLKDLLPRLERGSVLVLDNARSHHGGELARIVKEAGCSILYLPPYSPDLNPIELAWGWIKRRVRRESPRDAESRLLAIGSAISDLASAFAQSWFRKTGLQC